MTVSVNPWKNPYQKSEWDRGYKLALEHIEFHNYDYAYGSMLVYLDRCKKEPYFFDGFRKALSDNKPQGW